MCRTATIYLKKTFNSHNNHLKLLLISMNLGKEWWELSRTATARPRKTSRETRRWLGVLLDASGPSDDKEGTISWLWLEDSPYESEDCCRRGSPGPCSSAMAMTDGIFLYPCTTGVAILVFLILFLLIIFMGYNLQLTRHEKNFNTNVLLLIMCPV